MNYGKLYIVATPIGNMADISTRALECLKEVDLVACEDTRNTGYLLKKFDINKELFVYENARENQVWPILLEKLKAGKNIALVSDAGTPCISDPGFRLVRAARKNLVEVVPISGACAFISALSASGLPSDAFLFLGFLAPKTSARKNCFTKYLDFEKTLIFYESVHRIDKFITDALEVFGKDRVVCVAKEISKLHERFFVGTLEDVNEAMLKSAKKGEYVVIIAPKDFLL